MHVKLVTVLNVEHEVASVQILHHEEEVLLKTDAQVSALGQMRPDGGLDRF